MIAEIKNKISSSGTNLSDRLEDQLTGDVFGAIRYLPKELGIIPLISHCYSEDTGEVIGFLNRSDYLKYLFWPKCDTYGEIDLIIECHNDTKTILKGILGIEIKYNSPISSDQEIPEDSLTNESKVIHQLWRYMKFLSETYPEVPKALLFLTNDLEESKYH